MKKHNLTIPLGFLLTLLILLDSGFTSQTGGADFTVYDMVNAVNNLRSLKGLAPVQINPTIMAVAQDHTEYQSATHRSSHGGRTGGIVTDRVAASGYGGGKKIVAGENVASLDLSVTGMLEIIMNEIWADPVHGGAMVNPKYQDVGVGIASDGEMVYVTLDLAGVVDDAASAGAQPTVSNAGEVASGANKPQILPLYTCTPMPDGSVYHTVGYGQTLRTIAQIYQVDINDLANINQIDPNKIYAGQKLWIKKVELPTITLTQTITSTLAATATGLPPILISPTNTVASTPTRPVETTNQINTREVGILLIFLFFIFVLVYFLIMGIRSGRRSE